jgi:hypothetical protein
VLISDFFNLADDLLINIMNFLSVFDRDKLLLALSYKRNFKKIWPLFYEHLSLHNIFREKLLGLQYKIDVIKSLPNPAEKYQVHMQLNDFGCPHRLIRAIDRPELLLQAPVVQEPIQSRYEIFNDHDQITENQAINVLYPEHFVHYNSPILRGKDSLDRPFIAIHYAYSFDTQSLIGTITDSCVHILYQENLQNNLIWSQKTSGIPVMYIPKISFDETEEHTPNKKEFLILFNNLIQHSVQSDTSFSHHEYNIRPFLGINP